MSTQIQYSQGTKPGDMTSLVRKSFCAVLKSVIFFSYNLCINIVQDYLNDNLETEVFLIDIRYITSRNSFSLVLGNHDKSFMLSDIYQSLFSVLVKHLVI